MALDGHVAVGVIGIVIVEADGEIAAERVVGPLAQQLFAHGLHEGVEGHFKLVAVEGRRQRDLHGDHIEHPRAVLHFLGQLAQLVDVEAAPHAFQIHRAAAHGRTVQLVEQIQQRAVGQPLHLLGIVGEDIAVQRLFPNQLPAQIQRGLEVHIVVPAHQLAEGTGMGRTVVDGQAGLVVDGGLPGGQVHPNLQVVAVPQGLAQRAHAVDHHGALGLVQLFLQRLHLFGVLQAFVALHEAAAVQQHGVAVTVGGQIGSQLFIQLFFVHGQSGRVDQLNVFHKFFQLTGQRADLRARVAVDTHAGLAGLDLPGDLLRHGLGAFDQPVLHGLGGVNGIDRIGIHVGIGMEHKTHGFFLL